MVRRPVAWIVAIVLFAEALGIAALNWFMGVVVDRQDMSLAGLDPDVMSTSSKAGGVVFGLYFAFCGLVALLVALRNRPPAGFGRVLLISVAVVHGLLGAVAWGLLGVPQFLFMVVMLTLIVLLLMTYDAQARPAAGQPGPKEGSQGPDGAAATAQGPQGEPAPDTGVTGVTGVTGKGVPPQGPAEGPRDAGPTVVSAPPGPTTP